MVKVGITRITGKYTNLLGPLFERHIKMLCRYTDFVYNVWNESAVGQIMANFYRSFIPKNANLHW